MCDPPDWDNLHYNNDDRIDIHITKEWMGVLREYKAVIIINGKYLVARESYPDQAAESVLKLAHTHVSELQKEKVDA